MANALDNGAKVDLRLRRSRWRVRIGAFVDDRYLGEVVSIEPTDRNAEAGPAYATVRVLLANCSFTEIEKVTEE